MATAREYNWTVDNQTDNSRQKRLNSLHSTQGDNNRKIIYFQGGPSGCFCFRRRRHLSIRTWTTVAKQLREDWKSWACSAPTVRTRSQKRASNQTTSPTWMRCPSLPTSPELMWRKQESIRNLKASHGTRSHLSHLFYIVRQVARNCLPWTFIKGRHYQKKRFQPDSSTGSNQKVKWTRRWESGWEKSMSSNLVVFPHISFLLIYDLMRAQLSSAIKTKGIKPTRNLPSLRVD